MEKLIKLLTTHGEKLPKKHGEWRRLNVFGTIYLLLDSWNGSIAVYDGCESTGTDNMYSVVYTFKGYKHYVENNMVDFWLAHLCHLSK